MVAGVDDLSGPRLYYPDATAGLFDALLGRGRDRRPAPRPSGWPPAAGRALGRVVSIRDPRIDED